MKKRLIDYLLLSLMLMVASACGKRTETDGRGVDTLLLRHAEKLTVTFHEGYTKVTLANPWKPGRTLHTYVLVPSDAELPPHLPEGTVVRTPLRRAAVFTTVHCALLVDLRRQSNICGVADLKYIHVPWIQQQCAAGRVADFGDGMSPVIEKIIDQRPDAILLSPFENSGGYGKLDELGIPIIECAEYMESTPLGRAEWMRLYGLLFGAEDEADSLFRAVEGNYEHWKKVAHGQRERPKVMMDKQTGGVWYVPGGRSTIGQMLQDAHADYPYAGNENSGSLSLPFEQVLEKCGDADFWLLRYDGSQPLTRRMLMAEKGAYGQFGPMKTGQVYGCNVETSLFYEETPFHPDLLLANFVSIFHPQTGGREHEKYFIKAAE